MTTFPTGKPHISFSEVKTWKECSWKHKLVYINKIDMFKPSPYLDFGTILHTEVEGYLKNKTFDCKSIKDALYILIQVTFTLIILTGFTMWLIFIRYIVLYFPNFITFVMGYCACALVIASALFHIDKLFELNSLEPTYLSIM